jgi:hypothetical protein
MKTLRFALFAIAFGIGITACNPNGNEDVTPIAEAGEVVHKKGSDRPDYYF